MNTNSQNDITDQYVDELSHDEEFNHTTYEDDYNTQDDSVGFEEDLPIEKPPPFHLDTRQACWQQHRDSSEQYRTSLTPAQET